VNFLSIDIGTTCTKCGVFDEKGHPIFFLGQESPLIKGPDGFSYIDIDRIVTIVHSLLKSASSVGDIVSLAISSLGESFVLLDENDDVIFRPMVYTDPRGEEECLEVSKLFGDEYLFSSTGTVPAPMYSIYKLLWIKKHRSEIYKKAKKIMLIGDYVNYLLTGNRSIDYSLAARTGAFDIKAKKFDEKILGGLKIPLAMFSTPHPTGSLVGKILPVIAEETGLSSTTKVILGSHDQVCATLGAGVYFDGGAADGMGTVECLTAVYKNPPSKLEVGRMGYSVVPYAIEGLYCTYILNFSSGSLVNWFKNEILHKFQGSENSFFKYIENGFTNKPSSVLVLPYFGGAATPNEDTSAKGAILNLTLDTKDSDIYQAMLEGIAFEMRLNLDVLSQYGVKINEAVASGGGSVSSKWLQIKSDITGLTISSLITNEGGLLGLAVIQAVHARLFIDYESAIKAYRKIKEVHHPNLEAQELYEKPYSKYRKLYQTLKEFE